MKKIICCISLLICTGASGQNDSPEFSVGYHYLNGITFTELGDYKLDSEIINKSTALRFVSFSFKFPLSKHFNICPIGFFSIGNAPFSAKYSKGTIMPKGTTVYLPYSNPDSGWSVDYYSPEYVYFVSDVQVSKKSYGALFTTNLNRSFEAGFGLLINRKKERITTHFARDYYLWSHDDLNFDYYDYVGTSVSERIYNIETLYETSTSLSVVLNYKFWIDRGFIGVSSAAYISKDFYYSLGFNVGFQFK